MVKFLECLNGTQTVYQNAEIVHILNWIQTHNTSGPAVENRSQLRPTFLDQGLNLPHKIESLSISFFYN
jgi:hypothetical protein